MDVKILNNYELDKYKWDKFIVESPEGMIYSTYDFLCHISSNWKSIVVSHNNILQAVMPFQSRKKYGISYSLQPIFTHYWGVMFRPFRGYRPKVMDQKKQCLKLIINKIPKNFLLFRYNFSPNFNYPLPFLWNNFGLDTRYTYQIDLNQSLESIWSNIASHNRRDIRKAEKSGVRIIRDDNVDLTINIFRSSKAEIAKNVSESDYRALSAIVKHHYKLGSSYVLTAMSKNGQAMASIVYFRFKGTVIYFFGSVKSQYRNEGAMSLILWEGLKSVSDEDHTFDFEGSMIESVERFYRGFGAEPVPYLQISRNAVQSVLNKVKL